MKAKRQRLDLSQTERSIFMDIVKKSEGGKLFTTVMSGTTTNEMKFKVWQKVSNLFRDCTGKDLDHIKCRKLFGRLKSEEKQKHDSLAIKQFTVECGKTGGVAGPEAPPEMDAVLQIICRIQI